MKIKRIRKRAFAWFIIQIVIQIVALLLIMFNRASLLFELYPLQNDFGTQHVVLIISGVVSIIGFLLILIGRKLGFYIVSASLILRWMPLFSFGIVFIINNILPNELLIIIVHYLVLQIGGEDNSWSRMM